MISDRTNPHEVFAQETGFLINGTAAPALPAIMAQDRDHPLTATPLTRREREVAVLLACGLTNRQIAAALVVTEKTVEAHVGHILGKLGLSSRVQLAAWTLRNAQRAIQARAESLATLVHALQNPLTAIRAGAEILERYARPVDGEPWRAGLATIQANIAKMGTLVDELLAVAHPAAPRPVDRRRRPADLVAPARNAVTSHEPAAVHEPDQVDLGPIAAVIWQTGPGSGPIRPAARQAAADPD